MIQRTTPEAIESYLSGRWGTDGTAAAGPASLPTTLVNPATEEPLAEVRGSRADAGADVASALHFARERGGPELRALTFRERGGILRTLSRALHAHRDDLLTLSTANGGNTRSDAKFDVDGAIGTLAAYADLGEELGDARSLADGDAVQLGRSARLFGRHVWVPRLGVAVHVNAFNFPAWGLAEKAACALLAGMPVFTKPATCTALLAARVARIMIEAGVLPEGALSFYCGPGAGLADHLGAQDVLAFTGSSATAAGIRGGRSFVLDAARANVEADSLNAAVLGPDVALGSELSDLFVADVVRDMTQKAGQKCTAIRRAYVPAAILEAMTDRLLERLAAIRTGDPARDDVHMGPVATADQLADVRRGVATIATCGRVVCGGDRPAEVAGVDGDRGYFFAPTLVVAGDPAAADPVHTREVFGPVATLMPYDGSAEAAATRVGWGGGGLVASLYSDDRAFLTAVVSAIAPWHGRIVIGSTKTASQAIPPGTVLPSLVHGGPGRAGGGEELGGRRGLSLYMQRLALQGDRALLDALTR